MTRRMIAWARDCAAKRGLTPRDFEFQMLYGVRTDLQDHLAREGYTVRCYVPYGRHWYWYFLGCAVVPRLAWWDGSAIERSCAP